MTSVINPAAEPGPAAAGTSAERGAAEGGAAPEGAGPAVPVVPVPVGPDGAVPVGPDGAVPVGPYGAVPAWAGVGAYPAPPRSRFSAVMARLYARSPRWLAPAAILACFAGTTGAVLVIDPSHIPADAAPTCLVRLTTGFDCPGCGGTRAFWYLLNGNVPAAARHHLVFVFAVPFLIYLYVAWASEKVFGRRLPTLRLGPKVIGAFLGAWFAFTIVRNLPWAPFNWLYV